MANDYNKRYQIDGKEANVWHTIFNENNLENALDVDSKNQMHPRKGHKFIWDFPKYNVEGEVLRADLPQTSSTRLEFKWRFTDRETWPKGEYATTTLVLGDMGERTFIEMWIRNIPGPDGEQDQARWFWDQIFRDIEEYLENDPELEEAY